MSTGVSTSTDKIIVDKSRSHRNKAVSRAVRQTRERLQSSHSSNSAFDRDTLRMYVTAALQGATVMPLFIVIIAALGIYLTGNAQILLWALLTLVCHAGNILLVRRVRKQEITAENARGWRRLLLAGQFAVGCCWALFALQGCSACDPAGFTLYKGATLLKLISILKRALPEHSEQDIFWGYHFVTGALMNTLARTGRIDRLSGGLCRSDDFPAVKQRIARFMAAGFLALKH